MTPSENCCSPNNNGMLAKGICEGLLTFSIVAMPVAVIINPPAKLAPAEKHIITSFLNKYDYIQS
jgi:hypothetical protein